VSFFSFEVICRGKGRDEERTAMLTRTETNRFGWVNASYVYGLQIVSAHMRRALGTLTPYETFVKALEENRAKALAELV
jgi:hypothetical protein